MVSLGLGSLLDAGTQIGVHTMEHAVGGLANTLVGGAQVRGNIVDEVVLLAGLATQDLPKTVGLDVILIGDGQLLNNDGAGPLLVLLASLQGLVVVRTEGGGVVGVGSVVTVHVHVAITVPGAERAERAVDGDLLVVAAQTVALGVGVGEEAGLQDWVGRGLDARNHVRRREGGLLNLGEVVLGVLVESELAEAAQRDLTLRPDLGQVKDAPAELLGLLRAQNLDIAGP